MTSPLDTRPINASQDEPMTHSETGRTMTNAALAAEFEREAALVDAGEPETLTVFGEVCLNNLPALLSALRIADEAREAGWTINGDGSITRPAYGADFIAALEDGDLIIGEQRREIERLREGLGAEPSEEEVARAIAAAFGTSWEAGVVSYRADPEIADEDPTCRFFLAASSVLSLFGRGS